MLDKNEKPSRDCGKLKEILPSQKTWTQLFKMLNAAAGGPTTALTVGSYLRVSPAFASLAPVVNTILISANLGIPIGTIVANLEESKDPRVINFRKLYSTLSNAASIMLFATQAIIGVYELFCKDIENGQCYSQENWPFYLILGISAALGLGEVVKTLGAEKFEKSKPFLALKYFLDIVLNASILQSIPAFFIPFSEQHRATLLCTFAASTGIGVIPTIIDAKSTNPKLKEAMTHALDFTNSVAAIFFLWNYVYESIEDPETRAVMLSIPLLLMTLSPGVLKGLDAIFNYFFGVDIDRDEAAPLLINETTSEERSLTAKVSNKSCGFFKCCKGKEEEKKSLSLVDSASIQTEVSSTTSYSSPV